MIDSLAGKLTVRTPTALTVEVGGVGFEVQVPLSTFSEAPRVGQPVRLLTHLHVREDQLKLYGFATDKERELFRMLVGVNRIGPGVAIQILSSCNVDDFRRYVMAGDVKALASLIKGVGKKTAQRLVLELKGELVISEEQESLAAVNPAAEDAVKALISLGETPAGARKIVKRALDKLGPDADEQALMREALSG